MSSEEKARRQNVVGSLLIPDSARLIVRHCGLADYEATWRAMLDFTARRNAETSDKLWVCQHPPVYTLGQAGKPEHRLAENGIPMVRIDRGGQITYYGPGQVVVYLLLDLVHATSRCANSSPASSRRSSTCWPNTVSAHGGWTVHPASMSIRPGRWPRLAHSGCA